MPVIPSTFVFLSPGMCVRVRMHEHVCEEGRERERRVRNEEIKRNTITYDDSLIGLMLFIEHGCL